MLRSSIFSAIFVLSGVLTVSAGVPRGNNLQTAQRSSFGVPAVKLPPGTSYLPDRVIVKVRGDAGGLSKQAGTLSVSALGAYARKFGVTAVEPRFAPMRASRNPIDLSAFQVVRFSSPYDAAEVARELSTLPGVEYAEPWLIRTVSGPFTPDDSLRAQQTYLNQIKADTAWGISTGDSTVIIAIDDTGVKWDHPDLAANIWINPGEYGPDGLGGRKESNGIDDDGNGKVDDWHGWDFGGSTYQAPVPDNDPAPVNAGHGHGTHVAGLADAVTNNHIGISGMGFRCRILPIKASSDNDTRSSGTPFIVFGDDAIAYAYEMGASVCNCSWGGLGYSESEKELIDSARAHGMLVVAAAGNSGTSDLNYPASYTGVMSVGAVSSSDAKSYYSQYNDRVTVSAPGDNLLSTWFPTPLYATLSGTSMATPLVSGLAGLVKSHFPGYTPDQIREQIRVTCDDISNKNTLYPLTIGRGRINAYNALNTATLPSIRMIGMQVRDSANLVNAQPAPGQTFSIVGTFMNYLAPLGHPVTLTLTTSDANVTVVQGSYQIGSLLATGGIDSNATVPFRVLVKTTAPLGASTLFALQITDSSGYTDFQPFSVIINPTTITHTANNVRATLTSNGRIGFTDLNQSAGVGFIYHQFNQLFEGGLLVGTSATKIVDVVRTADQSSQDNDFAPAGAFTFAEPGPIADQEGIARFSDSLAAAANKVGVRVTMHSYQFASGADSNYVIVRYDLTNSSGAALSNLYAGLFFDWDIQPQYSTNKSGFDAGRSLGYAWDTSSSGTYCGATVLEGTAGFHGLLNSNLLDLSRSGKWNYLSGGVVQNDTAGDVLFTVSAGPFNIDANATKMLAFALVAGSDLPGIRQTADLAAAKWAYIKSTMGVGGKTGIPERFALGQNQPNPFNPATTISYDVSRPSRVTIGVYDVLGRLVTTLQNGERQPGNYSVVWNADQVPSGVYFYRMEAVSQSGSFSQVRKMLLLR